MKNNLIRILSLTWLWLTITTLPACGPAADKQAPSSDILVTDVDHSAVKRQSIGNCWIYAHASWLESLYKSHHQQEINVSESYWTYWHWYEQVMNGRENEIQTGGFWDVSSDIIMSHGFVLEGQFAPEEEQVEMSIRQEQALNTINYEMRSGRLADSQRRSPKLVRTVLDEAFGVDMDAIQMLAQRAENTVIGIDASGQDITVATALDRSTPHSWRYVSFPRLYGQFEKPSAEMQQRRNAVFRRVMKALNDSKPVVMSLMIDFNALDVESATFRAETLRRAAFLGRQGGHMVALEDYVVTNVPGYGTIGEGNTSDEVKQAALQGELVYLKSKNSWGTNRPDRGLTDGYTRFDVPYMTEQLEWKRGESEVTSFYTGLSGFILPPGY